MPCRLGMNLAKATRYPLMNKTRNNVNKVNNKNKTHTQKTKNICERSLKKNMPDKWGTVVFLGLSPLPSALAPHI